MKRPQRHSDGYYHIDGKKYKELFGSRIQVWNGNAYKTSGELTRKELIYNKKTHRIVSLSKHKTAKKEKRLEKYGFFAEKGKFGYVKKTAKRRRQLKKRGGDDTLLPTDNSANTSTDNSANTSTDNSANTSTDNSANTSTDNSANTSTDNSANTTNPANTHTDSANPPPPDPTSGGKKQQKRKQ